MNLKLYIKFLNESYYRVYKIIINFTNFIAKFKKKKNFKLYELYCKINFFYVHELSCKVYKITIHIAELTKISSSLQIKL